MQSLRTSAVHEEKETVAGMIAKSWLKSLSLSLSRRLPKSERVESPTYSCTALGLLLDDGAYQIIELLDTST